MVQQNLRHTKKITAMADTPTEDLPPVDDATLLQYKDSFGVFDVDGDGTLPTRYLGIVIRSLGKNPTDDEVAELIKETDTEGRGCIDFPEFLSIMSREIREPDSLDDIVTAFRVFDRKGTGFIPTSELHHIMQSMGDKLTQDEVEELLAEADKDNTGSVNYIDFINSLMQIISP